MFINLNQLYTFFVVINSGSFAKASEKLFITEPAVFMQIKSLEQQLGHKLIDRNGKDLKLTDLGEIIYNYCKKIFCLVYEMQNVINDFRDLKLGILKIGMAKVLLHHLMPFILPTFMDRYPNIKIQLEEASTMDLINGLINRNYELIMTSKIPSLKKENLNFVSFTSSCLYLVGSPKNPISQRGYIDLKELSKIPVILKDKRSITRHIVMETFKRLGIKPFILLESNNLDFIKRLVQEDKGFSFLSDLCIREELKKGELKVIKIDNLKMEYHLDIIYLKNRTLSIHAKTFLDYLMSIKKDNVCEIINEFEKGG